MEANSARQEREFDVLERRVRELERRVSALEGAAQGNTEPAPAQPEVLLTSNAGPAIAANSAGIAAVLGHALLAIAGAYLLRALTEWSVLPRLAGVGAGLVYGGYWLFSSARLPAADTFGAGVRAVTAAAIIAPMLWETTVRFAAVPSHGAAAVLVAFGALALALTWHRKIAAIARVTAVAVVTTSAALVIGTHDLTPFTIAALVMAALVEFAAVRNHWLDVRWVVAAGADLTIVLLQYLLNRPHGFPAGYAPIPAVLEIVAPAALAAIYVASTAARTLLHGEKMCWFEAGQVTVALWLFLTAALGAHAGGTGTIIAGVLCAALGAGCYLAAFLFLDRRTGHDRSFYIYVNLALALTIAGSIILLSGVSRPVILGVLSAGALIAGERSGRTTLRVHGTVYLVVLAVTSGLVSRASERVVLYSRQPWAPITAEWIAAFIATAACYLLVTVRRVESSHWMARAIHAVIALLLCWSGTALVMGGAIQALGLLMAGEPDRSLIASTRTLVTCLEAIALAWAAGRYRLEELGWIMYACIVAVAVKLLAEDVYLGRPGPIAVSLLSYAGALILAPRLAKPAARLA
jgi:hypothetical protein